MRSKIRKTLGYWKNAHASWKCNHQVSVISTGGVASSALMRHIEKFTSINSIDNKDGLKHKPIPPCEIAPDQKMLFIYSEPEAARRSIERRGWLNWQSAKLGSLAGGMLPKPLSRFFFENAVKHQIDRYLGFERQYPDKVKCIKYNAIWDCGEQLSEFLDIRQPEFISQFPKRRARKS